MQAEKKVQWQAEGEGDIAAMKEEVKKEEEEEEESEEEGEEITGGLLPQDLSKLDVSSLTPLTPEVIRCAAYFFSRQLPSRQTSNLSERCLHNAAAAGSRAEDTQYDRLRANLRAG